MKKTIIIDGMSCKHCVVAVERALEELENVSKVKVYLDDKKAEVYGENLDDLLLKEAVDEAGYKVIEIR